MLLGGTYNSGMKYDVEGIMTNTFSLAVNPSVIIVVANGTAGQSEFHWLPPELIDQPPAPSQADVTVDAVDSFMAHSQVCITELSSRKKTYRSATENSGGSSR